MFEIYQDKAGEYRFRLKAKNGQNILASEGYKQKASCENGIESVRKNSQDDSKFELKEETSGKWHFNLKAANGQIIGTSQSYETESGAKNGIASVKTNALDAEVKEVKG
ncbi:YegP family protein [Empedobacter falsenii]|uniref:YegP family protein n=2 Tax=Empedobacter TaxID=59734 RepID=A0ABY8VAK6_9FLAO|nr:MULTISPECIES: YegP family protein [Empedobacter]NOJ75900.1 YegP family protein [Empedobacter stercoris]WIH98387.1 YegP family protein [Empedobacter falsenii]HJD87393.1 YegP family protein [Empedobacter falsenii]